MRLEWDQTQKTLLYSLAKEVQSFGMHLPDMIQVNKLGEFLTDQYHKFILSEKKRKTPTPRAASVSSTCATSHQLSRRHKGPSSPGRTTRYDLKSAVSTTWAHKTSCSGVRDENGASGISRSESQDVSDKEAWR
jgi:hypothetical protein